MPVAPGQMLSHYHLIEKMGEGGMGVVWKADDTVLGRQVAIKILPEAFASDTERLARFKQEARLLASLNHSNIAAIHGLEESDGVRYLVLELVPGQTLAECITHGPLPVDEALTVCRQIAEALESAHETGIIHRDLKPANVKVTPDGKVKVLDFGLAKAFEAGNASGPIDTSLSPTLTTAGTMAGVILGTAAYMSPEQACGKAVDRRADIWSFGCVLYEMLTGNRCFGGETPSETLARILEREPGWSSLPGRTPAAIRELLSRCLRKDPKKRLRDIGEARVAIEDLDADEPTKGQAAARRSWRSVLPWCIAAVMAAGAIVVAWMGARPEPPAHGSPTRLVVSVPQDQRLAIADATSLAVSPDGSRLVYAASSRPGSRPHLWLRRLDRFEAAPIPGSEGAVGPFFSPDGRWLGYFAEGKLFRISVEGGAPDEVCHVGQVVPGASWGLDDTIIYTNSPSSGLLRVPAAGGTPEPLTTPKFAEGEIGHGWPQLLPDGESVLFTISDVKGTRIAALSLGTGEWRTLAKGMAGARYLPTGHLVYARLEGLAAVAFDPVRLETKGSPVVVLEDVYTIPALKGFGLAAFSVSDTGMLVYLPGGAEAGENRLVWVDRDGRTRPATSEAGGYEWPRLSPDGKKVAVDNRTADGEVAVWILDIERDARSRLTLDENNILPIWTPDGKQIVFGSNRGGSGVVNIFRKAADGSGKAHLLLEGENPRFPRSFTPDGMWLAFTEWNPDTMRDIWILALSGEHEAAPVLNTRFDEHSPIFSPDGRWLAYVSDESGRDEVYLESHPRGHGRWLISAGGGKEPVWSADGRELFYRNADAMMVVSVRTDGELSAGIPTVVFEKSLKSGIYDSLSYDVSADGQRFLMIERNLESAPTQLNVVLDWQEELRHKVPVDGV
jgi:serine/threonine-protein kinase